MQTRQRADESPTSATLIRTKLQKPSSPPGVVPRPNLLERLARTPHAKLTLICAPAGYGKTTLVSNWLETNPLPAAWLALDAADDDPYSFLAYFLAAVQSVAPGTVFNCQALLHASHLPPQPHLRKLLLSDLSALSTPLCLVLDDYHEIHHNTIHQLIADLLRFPLPHFHLLIITRHDPPFSLSRLRGSQQLVELRARDLRFSPDDARLYLNRLLETDVEPALVADLVERTEGWAVGLRMAALGMRDANTHAAFVASFHGNYQFITAYLVDEVLVDLPQPVKTFLLRTAILERFSADLCDALMQADPATNEPHAKNATMSSQAILTKLARDNLFLTPLDEERTWFRYHNLFRDLLLHRLTLETTNAERTRLHIAAATWLDTHEFIEEALRQHLTAADIDGAVALVQRHRHELMNSEQWYRLDDWIRQFSTEQVHEYPELLIARTWLDYYRGSRDSLAASLERIETALDKSKLDGETVRQYHSEMAALRSLLAFRAMKLDNTIEYAQYCLDNSTPKLRWVRQMARLFMAGALKMQGDFTGALAMIHEGYTEEETPSKAFRASILSDICHLYWDVGDLYSLAQIGSQVLVLSQTAQNANLIGWGHLYVGYAAYEHNDIETAQQHFAAIVEQPHLNYGTCYAYGACGLALCYLARNRPVEATAVADSAAAFHRQNGTPDLTMFSQAFQMDLAIRQGDVATTVAWADRCGLESARVMLTYSYQPVFTLIKVWLAQDSSASRQKAKGLLEQLEELAATTHAVRYQIEALALLALLHRADDETLTAQTILGKAISLAQQGGFIRVFVDLGAPMAELLRTLSGRDNGEEKYINQLHAAFAQVQQPQAAEASLSDSSPLMVETLTGREMDVLHLLAERLTNKEIAAELVISTNTVSTYTRTLFAKLDVHNRRQAVARAIEHGLISAD